jgi:hypothetical protein
MPETPGFPFTCFVPGPWPPGGALALGDRWSTEWIPNDGRFAAAEHQAGRARERSEVEALRDRAICITMEPADARAMERTRGYADVDPELVWEHWEVLRNGMRGR